MLDLFLCFHKSWGFVIYFFIHFIFSCLFSFPFLLFRLGNFYCFIFEVTNVFLCPIHSAMKPTILWGFSVCLFVFAEDFYFFFYLFWSMFIVDHWSIFMMASLKFLWDDFIINVTWVLLSVNYFSYSSFLFKLKFSWLLNIWWIIFKWNLDILNTIWDSGSHLNLLT